MAMAAAGVAGGTAPRMTAVAAAPGMTAVAAVSGMTAGAPGMMTLAAAPGIVAVAALAPSITNSGVRTKDHHLFDGIIFSEGQSGRENDAMTAMVTAVLTPSKTISGTGAE